MALIKCSECGHEVSNQAVSCPYCGNPINRRRESKIMVYGYTDSYIINPSVRIFVNGYEVGSVPKGQLFEYNIKADSEVLFRCNMRKARVFVKAGRVTKIKLAWNRLTGQLVPQVVDSVTPDGGFW